MKVPKNKLAVATNNLLALGKKQVNLRQYLDARDTFIKAIALKKDSASAHNELGKVYVRLNAPKEAISSFMRAIECQPNYPEPYFNLGLELFKSHQYEEAAQSFQLAFTHDASYSAAHDMCGLSFVNLAKMDQARDQFILAIHADPKNFGALNNLGNYFLLIGELEKASVYLHRSIDVNPTFSDAHFNLGILYIKSNDYEKSLRHSKLALQYNPNRVETYHNLAIVYKEFSQPKETYMVYKKILESSPYDFLIHSNKLFNLLEIEDLSPEAIFKEHCGFGVAVNKYLDSIGYQKSFQYRNTLDLIRKLKIGFVSGDLRSHPIANFMEPIFANINKEKFQIFAYSNCPTEDHVSDRLRIYFDSWHKVDQLSDEELAARILNDEIDILIDLSGHTALNRLVVFGMKPAPIQLSWIGYPGTTGMSQIDYYFYPNSCPSGIYDSQYVEKIAYIPSAFAFQPAADSPDVNPLPAISNGFLTFGIFNNSRKFSEKSYEIWADVLKGLPSAKLLIAGLLNDSLKERILEKLASLGVDIKRITIYPRLELKDYLALHHLVDICLDTYPYTGGTTTNHAVWMGVPTLTLRGETQASLQTHGILDSYGLSEWSCGSKDEYMQKVLYWSENTERLADLRQQMRQNMLNSLGDTSKSGVLGVERAFRHMWSRYITGLPPESFRLDA